MSGVGRCWVDVSVCRCVSGSIDHSVRHAVCACSDLKVV